MTQRPVERARGALLEVVLGSLGSPAFAVGPDNVVLAWNADAEISLGIAAAECVGRRVGELACDVPGLRAALEEARASGHELLLKDVPTTTARETTLTAVRLVPLPAADDAAPDVLVLVDDRRALQTRHAALAASHASLLAAFDTMRDEHATAHAELRVTNEELETTNEELQVTNEELQVANEELRLRIGEVEAAHAADAQKNQFLAMLAHELRNPLAPIMNALYIIRRRSAGDAQVDQALRIAERQVRHQARLLDDLLDVSRIVLGKIELRLVPVDAVDTVRQAVEAARPAAAARAHSLEVALPDEPLVIQGDSTRLEQVVRNLLANAVKYTDPGGRIDVALTREDGVAVLRVRDTGIGIAPEMLPHIFDLFAQADSSLARAQGGLGIGLTLARRLVQLHGGTIAARSPGVRRGSEFEVRLPLAPAAPMESADAPVASARPLRILLVEDNADSREMLRVALETAGHRVDTASDGHQAVATAVRTAPEVVLIDIGLPGIDGYEVARRIRRRVGAAVRLVALTGYGGPEARRQGREAGFDLHLVKPVSPEDLAAALGSARG